MTPPTALIVPSLIVLATAVPPAPAARPVREAVDLSAHDL
jgi:hypothetical protein